MGKLVVWRWVLLVALFATLVPHTVGAGVQRTEVVIADDWPADSLIDPGTITCPGGELGWLDPVTPVCPGSGRFTFGIFWGMDATRRYPTDRSSHAYLESDCLWSMGTSTRITLDESGERG